MQRLVKKSKKVLVGSVGVFAFGLFAANAADSPDVAGGSDRASAPASSNFGTERPSEKAGNEDPATAAKPASGGTTSDTQGNSTGTALDYMFNRKPQEGSMASQAALAQKQANGKAQVTEALGGRNITDAQVQARFDRYLGTPEVSPETLKAYEAATAQILALLRQGNTFQAWKGLYPLATYRNVDLGVAGELANRIESVWNSDQASSKIGSKNGSLEEQIKTQSRNADIMERTNRQKDLDVSRQEGGRAKPKRTNNGGVPQADTGKVEDAASDDISGLAGKLEMTQTYLNSLETKARIKMNELRAQKLLDSAKSNFADYIGTLFKSKHYQHVILAAEFYRKIFNEDEYPVALANQVNTALEQQREVQSEIEVFSYNLDKNNVVAATDRLQEAFQGGEYQPAVLGVKRAAKDKVADYLAKIDKLANLMEAKDFGGLSTALEAMKKTAADFDAAKPLAMVNAVKLESRLRMGKAKLAAQAGDNKMAMEEFQAAAEAWPDNPDLQSNATTFFSTHDVQNQSIADFDHLVEENNYRAIFDKQLAFAPAIHGDAKRETALKDALLKTQKAELAVQKATLMGTNGDVYGAWETIELAVKDLPQDNKLNAMRGDLAGRGAEFVAAINKAREAEARSDLGYSLTWFAIAQRSYPASVIANEAMDRLSKKILTMN